MPTGGVDITEDNISTWFKADVIAVGIGLKLISKELVDLKDWEAIARRIRNTLELILKFLY